MTNNRPMKMPPVTISADLRLNLPAGGVVLTPVEALQIAERITLAATLRQAALMPERRPRHSARFISGNLASVARKVLAA